MYGLCIRGLHHAWSQAATCKFYFDGLQDQDNPPSVILQCIFAVLTCVVLCCRLDRASTTGRSIERDNCADVQREHTILAPVRAHTEPAEDRVAAAQVIPALLGSSLLCLCFMMRCYIVVSRLVCQPARRVVVFHATARVAHRSTQHPNPLQQIMLALCSTRTEAAFVVKHCH